MDKIMNHNEQDQFSMNFDDNYNEQQFLKNANKKDQKLSIMDGFGELCQKLNYQTSEDKENQKQQEDKLLQYYAQCKEKAIEQQQIKRQTPKTNENNLITSKLNKPSPIQTQQNVRSTSGNYPLTPMPNRIQSTQITHERNPSYGENVKKTLHEVDINDSKRNYSSVEEKKKILQPTKNIAKENQATMKDYFGEENNFVNKKVHGKNFISKDPKTPKENQQNTQHQQNQMPHKRQPVPTVLQSMKFSNQNSLKESNLITTMKRIEKSDKQLRESKNQRLQRPSIILYKKVIDLSQSTEAIIEAFKSQQVKSDYEIFSQSQSTIEEGLFAKAIVHQRATKTVQSAQSPSPNYLQPSYKENGKQYISSPINISYSPNPTNNYKSIFQKREVYR